MHCISYDTPGMHGPLLGCMCFFHGAFLHSRVTGACPVTTDLIMRVHVRTTYFSFLSFFLNTSTAVQLLDKPWSQVSFLLPPDSFYSYFYKLLKLPGFVFYLFILFSLILSPSLCL